MAFGYMCVEGKGYAHMAADFTFFFMGSWPQIYLGTVAESHMIISVFLRCYDDCNTKYIYILFNC